MMRMIKDGRHDPDDPMTPVMLQAYKETLEKYPLDKFPQYYLQQSHGPPSPNTAKTGWTWADLGYILLRTIRRTPVTSHIGGDNDQGSYCQSRRRETPHPG